MSDPTTAGLASCSHLGEHRQLVNHNRYAASVVFSILDRLLSINSVLDLGCGIGVWMQAALDRPGREVVGVDLETFGSNELLVPTSAIISATLGETIDLHRRFDLALCLETAEHIAAQGAVNLVSNCVRHSDVILFSAAIPGQGGLHHVNEQPPEYWQRLFNQAGCDALDVIRPLIWHDTEIPAWYRQNMLLFVNRRARSTLKALRAEAAKTPIPLHRAHPDLFHWQARELALRQTALEEQNAKLLQAELRASELLADLAAQGDSRALTEAWGRINRVRSEQEADRSRMQVLESDRSAHTQHIATLQAALTRARRDMAELRSSVSWRMTAPLRMLGGQLRRMLHR